MIGRTIGHYQITEKIGEGGMGAVYKADDTTLPRTVAVKVLAGHLADDSGARQRFIREAEAASSLNHPNITTVYDLIREGDDHFLCLEYVDGKTIKELIGDGPLDPASAARIILQVAHALHQAHSNGILHRDIKSSNVMVTEEGRVKLLDFGLVHFDERSQLTQSGTTLGTISYSSPEQITGSGFDQRSDLFSLGIVFYELLTGQLPFRGQSEAEVMYAVINKDPIPLSDLVPGLSTEWDDILGRMFSKEPAERFQDARELAEEITSVLGISDTYEWAPIAVRRPRSNLVQYLTLKRLVFATSVLALIACGFILSIIIGPGRTADLVSISIQPFSVHESGMQSSDLALRMETLIRNELIQINSITVQESGSDISVDDEAEYLLGAQITGTGELILYYPVLIDQSGNSIWSPIYEFLELDLDLHVYKSVRGLMDFLKEMLTASGDRRLKDWNDINPVAFRLYEQGLALTDSPESTQEMLEGIETLKQSLDVDSTYTETLIALSEAYWDLGWDHDYDPESSYVKSRDAAGKALLLDRSNAVVYEQLAHISMWYDFDWEAARRFHEQAMYLSPNNLDVLRHVAGFLVAMRDFDESRNIVDRINTLDPQNVRIHQISALVYQEEYDRALTVIYEAQYHNPDNWLLHYFLSICYLMKGDNDRAKQAILHAEAQSDGPTDDTQWSRIPLMYAMLGDEVKAREYLNHLTDPLNRARVLANLGDHDEAIQLLQQALNERNGHLCWLYAEQILWGELRFDPQFQTILTEMNFPNM
ncbi:protein kinase [Candidatus Zixiibacteriota bacterium]